MRLISMDNLLDYCVKHRRASVPIDFIKAEKPIISTGYTSVKHGKWIAENQDNRGYADCYTCTNCKNYVYTYTLMRSCEFDYCPNCGALMTD